MSAIHYYTGLDLGQAQDFTALAVLERTTCPKNAHDYDPESRYAVRCLERLPLGTPYTAVCAYLAKRFAQPPLAQSTLVVDQTGVGRPVLDMLERSGIQAQLFPVTITAGHQANPGEGAGWCPRKSWSARCRYCCKRGGCRWRPGCRRRRR